VGAAPVQNIGAYGAEISHVMEKVRVLDTRSLEFLDLGRDEGRLMAPEAPRKPL
jgi:UDP-N-acetylenolpyruvoylglucosamine reductase